MGSESNASRVVKCYSEAFKRQVVLEVERGELTVRDAVIQYHIGSHTTINRWRRKYGTLRAAKIVRVSMKSEKSRIQQLEQLLADEKMKNKLLNTQLDIIEEDYGTEVKKKLSTERLKKYESLNAQRKKV